jgi:cyclophilin family peptidyl-prolyl cis-trans isomerase
MRRGSLVVSLAKSGFYDGLTFHRVVPDFVIQGGDPNGDGSGGSGKPPVVGEVPKDGYPLGSLAAAKAGTDPNGTFDSQFFIVTGAQGTQLPLQYARFGRVVSGMDVAQKIEALAPATGDGPPTQKVTMDKVTIAGA